MTTEIDIPSFNWSAFYYAQILESLIQFKRTNVPELSSEAVEEPLIQLLRSQACVGHLNNVNCDITANENTLPTAKLTETVRNKLRLIDYEMSPANPAFADIVLKLTQTFALTTEIVPIRSQVATKRQGTVAGVPFEFLAAVSTTRTDQVNGVLAWDESVGVFVDYTTEANDPTPGVDFTPWGSPVQVKDALYVGHFDVLWNQIKVELDTVGAGMEGVWEYYNGNPAAGRPDLVEKPNGYLKFFLDGVLGTHRRPGTVVRVQLDRTGAYLDIESEWNETDGNIIDTDGTASPFLGQSDPPSEDVDDYTVGSAWRSLDDVVDGTVTGGSAWAQAGDVDYTLPEGLEDEWELGTFFGIEAYWIRFRVVLVDTPTSPTIDELQIHNADQFLKATAYQGQSHTDSPLGTADTEETASQEFPMSKENFVWESETVTVDAVTWTRVDNFLQSKPTDRHYMTVLGENDRATVRFGDGVRGAIPTPTATIVALYRYGAQQEGNVGANTIIVDNSGIPHTANLWNPRAAKGWSKSQGADEASLELAKIQGPASLRVIETAMGPEDVEYMAVDKYRNPEGISPYSRAFVIEEGFGPKTMELVVVVAGATQATAVELDELDLYFNGDKYSHPPVRKRVVGNQTVVSTNHQQKTINISADVYGATTSGIVRSFLVALLQPEALQDDGVTWEWDFGEAVNISRISHELFESDEDIRKVANVLLNGGSSDIALESRQLPVAGTITITVYP